MIKDAIKIGLLVLVVIFVLNQCAANGTLPGIPERARSEEPTTTTPQPDEPAPSPADVKGTVKAIPVPPGATTNTVPPGQPKPAKPLPGPSNGSPPPLPSLSGGATGELGPAIAGALGAGG